MNTLLRVYLVGCFLTVSLSCQKITPISPPSEPSSSSSCNALPVKQNITGSWSFSTNLGSGGSALTKRGSVTFMSDGSFFDPDSLFSNRTDHGPVVSKEYVVAEAMSSEVFPEMRIDYFYSKYKQYGLMLWVRLSAYSPMKGKHMAEGWYFRVISNECNQIVLVNAASNPDRIVLMRQ